MVAEIEWPRSPRDASMLAGLLAASAKGRRHVAVLYEPIGPRAAERHLQVDKTRRDVAIRLRQRTGQIPPEREQRDLAVATAQDAELAAGHGLLRFAGYASVTVTDRSLLEEAWDELCADGGGRAWSCAAARAGSIPRSPAPWCPSAWACPVEDSRHESSLRSTIACTGAARRRRGWEEVGRGPGPRRLTNARSRSSAPRGRAARSRVGRRPLPQPSVWRATTASAAGIYPWPVAEPMPPVGAPIGYDVFSKSTFSPHPVEWVDRGIVTNPNVYIY